MLISPAESAAFITESATDVSIDLHAVNDVSCQLLQAFESGCYSIQDWKKHPLHPKVADEDAIDFIFFIDSLNFSFWTDEETEAQDGKYSVQFKGVSYTGYWALVAAIKKAIEEDAINITNPKVYSEVDEQTLRKIFRSETQTSIPLFEERLRILRENGLRLMTKFEGKFCNIVKECNGSAQSLLRLVIETFPSFRDECRFKGKTVSFYKRAQILVADIWACFEGKGLGHFHDIDSLTMFADYRVPQILSFYKVLKYSERLMEKLKSRALIPFGDPMEVEIRGGSIHAVELIKEEMIKMKLQNMHLTGDKEKVNINCILIDFYLWDMRRKISHEIQSAEIPFHRTRCVFY